MAAAKRPTKKQHPWLCDRNQNERVKRKYLKQAGPPFRTRRYKKSVGEAVFKCGNCGEYCVLPVYLVRLNRQHTCGCMRLIAKRKHPVLVDNKTIVRTQHLTQVGAQFRAGGTFAVFECSCGQRKVLLVCNVVKGGTISCGCTLADTTTMRLIVELKFFNQLRKCGVPVELECMSRETIAEQLQALHSVLGYRKQGEMIGLRDNAVGWKDGNIEWQSKRNALAGRQSRILKQAAKQLARLRTRTAEAIWRKGPKSERLAAVVQHCGPCRSEYHELVRINPQALWDVGNVQWQLPSTKFMELCEMESAMIERASRARKNKIPNQECQFCFSMRTRSVKTRFNMNYRTIKCHDCEKTFRVTISDHVTGSHQIDSDALKGR